MLTIIIPVRNEAENFEALWLELCASIEADFCAYVLYDFDADDTIPVVQRIIEDGDKRLRLARNSRGKGVVGAILTGFEQVERGPVLVVMADLSDDLKCVDRMLDEYRRGHHIVVGSRYMKGGRLIGGPWLKQILSRFAGVSLRRLRGLPTHDATNAFKIYDREMLRHLQIESRSGFEINLEITVKAFLAGFSISEVPTTWRDRTSGQSKFRLWAWLPKYLKWYLWAFWPRRRAVFVPTPELKARSAYTNLFDGKIKSGDKN